MTQPIPLHPTPPQAAVFHPRFTPERWLLLGRSEAWQASAEVWMQAHRDDPGPLGWRLRHGLLQFATLATLAERLKEALHTAPPAINLLVEPGAFKNDDGGIDTLVAAHWPPEAPLPGDAGSAPALRIGTAAAPFTACTARLAWADGAPAEQWLLSGRTVWPRIDMPQGDDDFADDALRAFEHWAAAFTDDRLPQDLDAIYGSADTYAERMAADWVDEESLHDQADNTDADRPPLRPVPGTVQRGTSRGRLGPQVLAAAAASAGQARRADAPIQGVFDRSDGRGPDDRYELRCAGQILAGREKDALTVKLALSAKRWQGIDRLVLEIHADGHPARLLHWEGLSRLQPAGNVLMLEQKARLSEAQRVAMWKGVELWLAPAAER